MNKIYSLITTTLLCFMTTAVWAQFNNDETIIVTEDDGTTDEIGVPEGMLEELDSLLNLYHTQNYLMKDEDCNLPDFNPTYEKEVYVDRLRRMPTIMEMAYNDVVRTFIDRYAARQRRHVSVMLGASNFYMPIFEQALESYGLPLELKYLPVIESGLNPTAVSRVGATGLWQFMIATGKHYGLEVTSLVDERCDPLLASNAAAHYLSDLYKIYGEWNLVIAAYNCGPENVNKAIHRAGGSKDYWTIYPYLPKETRGYVPAFIAANYIMNYYCEHNICPMVTNLPAKTDTIMIDRDVHFEQISQVLGISISQLRELNPQYRKNIVNGSYKLSPLRLPVNYINKFIDNADSIYAYNASTLLTKRAEVTINEDYSPVQVQTRTTTTSRYSRHSATRSSRHATRSSRHATRSSRRHASAQSSRHASSRSSRHSSHRRSRSRR